MLRQLLLSGATAATGQAGVCQLLGAASTLSHVAHVLLPQASKLNFSSSAAAVPTAAAAAADKKQQQQQPPKQQQQQKQQAAAAAEAAAAAQAAAAEKALDALKGQYQRSRLQDHYQHHLARELMLKLDLDNVQQLPRVKSVDLSINAKDTHGRRYAEKWEMLLPALALEYITGRPATFVQSTQKYYRSRNAVTAVKVRLQGDEALDLLQKLTYLVLPSQNAFSGISSRSLDRAGNLHFRVQKIINFPDFEEQFEIFEALGSLHVSINMESTAGHVGRSQLLMTGLQIPMLQKKGAAAADDAAAAAAAAADEETDSSGDDGYESNGRMSAADD